MSFDLGTARGSIVIDGDGVKKGIDDAKSSLESFSGKVSSVMGTAAKAFAAGGLAMGAAFSALIVGSTNMAADLEAQMSDIQAVMLASADEVELLKDLIIDLGLDPNLKVSTEEAASAIAMLGRNGVTTAEVLDGMAKAVVLLANATGADFGVAANIATDVMRLWGIEAQDVITAVDQLVAVTTNSKFTIDDFALALAQGGGVAATVGVSLQDFTAGVAAISPLFASGSDAGTSFKTMLQRLVPQSEKAKGAMAELGLEFFNADGSMKDLADIAGQLNEAFYGTSEAFVEVGGRTAEQNAELERLQKLYNSTLLSIQDYTTGIKGAGMSEEARAKKLADLQLQLENITSQMGPLESIQGEMIKTVRELSEEERNRYLTTIFGSDAMRAAAGLAQFTEEEFRALLETMAETDAAEAARIRMDNLKGSIEILGGVIEAIKLRIGDVFVPFVREVVEGITGFLEANEENIVGFFQNIMTIFEGFISGTPTDIPWDTMFPPAIAARLMDLSELVEDLGDIIRGVFDGTVDLNSKWEELLPPWAVDTAYRIADAIRFIQEKADTLAGALLGGLAGAGIAAALGAISGIIAALATPITAIIGVAALLGAAWGGNWLGIRDKAMEAWANMQPIFNSIREWLETDVAEALREARYFFDRFFERIQAGEEPLSAFIGILRQMGVPPEVTAKIRGLADSIQTIREKILEAGEVIQTLGQYFGFIIKEGDPLNDFLVDLPEPLQPLVRLFGEAFAAVRETVGGIVSFFQEQGAKIGMWFSENSELINDYIAVISRNLAVIIGVLAAVFAVLVREGARMWLFIEPLLSGIVDLILGLAKSAMQIATGDWAGAWETIKETAGQVWEALKEAFVGFADWVTGWFGTNWAAVLETWSTNWEMFKEIVSTAWNNIKEAIAAKIEEIKTAIVTKVQEIIQTWTDRWNAIRDGIAAIWLGITTGIAAAIESVRTTISQKVQAIKDFFTTTWEGIKQAVLNKLRELFSAMGLNFDEMAARWSAIWEDVKLIVSTVWEGIKTAVGTKIQEVVTAISTKMNEIKAGISAKWNEIKTAVETVWQNIVRAVTTKLDDTKRTVDTKVEETKRTWQERWNEILTTLIEKWNDIVETVKTKVGEVKEEVSTGIENALLAIREFITPFLEAGVDLIQGVIDGAMTLFETVRETVSGIFNNALTAVSETIGQWTSIGADIIQGILSGIMGGAGDVVSYLTGLAESAVQAVNDALGIESPSKVFQEIGQQTVEGLIAGFEELVPDVVRTVREVGQQAAKAAQEAASPEAFGEMAKMSVEGLIEGFEEAAPQVVKTLRDETNKLVDVARDRLGIASPSKVFHQIGQQIMQGLTEGVVEGGPAAVGGVGTVIGQIIDETVGGIPTLIGRIIDEVGTGVPLIIGRVIDEVEQQKPGVIQVVKKTAEEMIQAIRQVLSGAELDIEGLFKLGSGLGSFMSAITNRFQARELDPIKEQIDHFSDSLDKLFDNLDIDEDISAAELFKELARARLRGDTERERGIRQLMALQAKRNGLELEYQMQQEKILQLQKQQQDLAFLKSQLDFLTMITEAGLNPADILGGIELGINANLDELMEAMSIAMQAIVQQAEDELGIASPSRVFRDMFQQVITGAAKGLENLRPLTQAASRMYDHLTGLTDVPQLASQLLDRVAPMSPHITVAPVINNNQPRPVNFNAPVRIGNDRGFNLFSYLDHYQTQG